SHPRGYRWGATRSKADRRPRARGGFRWPPRRVRLSPRVRARERRPPDGTFPRRGPAGLDLRILPQRQHVAAADAVVARGRRADRRPPPRPPPRRVAADLAGVGDGRAPA